MIGSALTMLVCALVTQRTGIDEALRDTAGERRADDLIALHGLEAR